MREEGAPPIPLAEGLRPKVRFAHQFARQAKEKKLGTLGGVLLLAIILMAALATWIAPYGPLERIPGAALLPPSRHFLLGTDQVGRDLLSRLIHGARISLGVSISAVALSVVVGTTIGLVSGYFAGTLDMVVQRIMDAFMAVPTLILAMVIMAVMGQSLFNVVLAIGLASSTRGQRLIRATVLSAKQEDYVLAARGIGAGTSRILLRYILPNIMAVILIEVTLGLGSAILAESSLSFLGMGVPPPYPTWGGMLAQEGRTYMIVNPWLAIWPGLAVSLTVLGVNLFGDALRDAWDPKLKGR